MTLTNNPAKKFILPCDEINPRFKYYGIQTTDKEIKENLFTMNQSSKLHQSAVFIGTYKNLTKYADKEIDIMFIERNEKWLYWCQDIVLFYISRFCLFGKPIPINPLFCSNCGDTEKELLKCSICKLTRYCSIECQKANWKNHKLICKKC